MSYFCRREWVVQFLQPDLKTPVGRILTFADPDKIRELIARTPTPMNLETRNMLEHSITQGRGGLYLDLTNEQYIKLSKRRL
jgi:hypothetical protein